jgi:RNA polymerase sigma factor (sigma-70 family)
MGSTSPVPLDEAPTVERRFTRLFNTHHPRIFRYLDRLSGDPELAADIAQEVFLRLHRRYDLPDRPEAWLITVALNLFRNERSTGSRRRNLLTASRAAGAHSDPPAGPADRLGSSESVERVRRALDTLDERDRNLLLLRAEGYAYRDIAEGLDLNESSVGTLLARARATFRDAWEGTGDAR